MMTSVEPVVIVGGGQSGLVAARAVRDAGARPVVLEAAAEPVGSWPRYYDSLTLFSPARFSEIPGTPFGGELDRYPRRDEVVAYLRSFASALDVEIRTGTRVDEVAWADGRFVVHTSTGEELAAAGVVAASGAFDNPHLPRLPGQDDFAGEVLHVADYRRTDRFVGRRIVVVGGGNSAVQVGHELSQVAAVTVASRQPLRFLPQLRDGRDLHHWLITSGFDLLPPQWLARVVPGTLVMDTGDYRRAVETGALDWRPMFTGFDEDGVVWADGRREHVDVVLFATGYRPHLPYLENLGAVGDGTPHHLGGVSTTHPGLVYVGLEFQRSFASNTLRGVHRDVDHVLSPLLAHVGRAPALVGLTP